MDGIIIIDKPEGFTSHDVVARLRRILKTKKIGHTGTLDPFATGVLVMLVGKATRLAQFLDKDEKEYEAVVRFGFETETGDKTGMRSAECGMRNEELYEKLGSIEWEAVLQRFCGRIDQIPPMHSAKKVGGKKLYQHARMGVEIERKPIAVNILKLEVCGIATTDDTALSALDFGLHVTCSAGTYIRTLAQDIGRAVGVGAHLQELRRTRAGKFDISEAATLEELESETDPKRLLPMTVAVSHLPAFKLTGERVEKTMNGLSTRIETEVFQDGDAVRMIDENNSLIAIGLYDSAENAIRPKVVLV